MSLQVSTPSEEGVFQGAKFLKYHVLVDQEELAKLFSHPFSIYPLTGVVDGEPIDRTYFLNEYGRWISALQEGRVPDSSELRRLLASAFTEDASSLWKQAVPGGYLVKMRRPVVLVQAHFFTYSECDEVFRPMSMGPDAIFWGLQFSIPQVYQDPKTFEFFELERGGFWEVITQWVRNQTRPTPFIVKGKRTNVPIRLGKGCFSWIRNHPQLLLRGIDVDA